MTASLSQARQILALVEQTGWSGDEIQHRIIEHFGSLREVAFLLGKREITPEGLLALLSTRERVAAPQPELPPPSRIVVPQGDWRAFLADAYAEMGFGKQFKVPQIPRTTARQDASLETHRFLRLFVPRIREDAYPAHFVRPAWGKYLDAGQIKRIPLRGRWIAVETIPKSNWNDPNAYANDTLGKLVGWKARRFETSWDDLHGGLLAKAAKEMGFPTRNVRLCTGEEWNFIANAMNWLREHRGMSHLPDLGSTASWEWVENEYGSGGRRLVVGHRGLGGLAGVRCDHRGLRGGGIAFRVLAVL